MSQLNRLICPDLLIVKRAVKCREFLKRLQYTLRSKCSTAPARKLSLNNDNFKKHKHMISIEM